MSTALRDLQAKLRQVRSLTGSLLLASCLLVASCLLEPLPATAQATEDAQLQQLFGQVEQAQRVSDQARLADAYYELAVYYNNRLKNYAQAEEYMRKSLEVERTVNRPTKDELNKKLGFYPGILCNEHKLPEALAAYREYRNTAIELGKLDDAATIDGNVSQILLAMHKRDEAISVLQEAISRTPASLPKSKFDLLRRLANVYEIAGRLKDALTIEQQALQAFDNAGDDGERIIAIAHIGELQQRTGDLDGALKTFEAAVSQYDNAIWLEAICKLELAEGDAFYERGQVHEAVKHYRRSYQLLQADPTAEQDERCEDVIFDTLNKLAQTDADLEKFDEAETAHKGVLERASQKHHYDRAFDAAIFLSEDYLMHGRVEKALDVLRSYGKLAESTTQPGINKAHLLIELAKCYKELGQKNAAIQAARQGVNEFKQAGDQRDEAQALNVLASIYLSFGQAAAVDELAQQSQQLMNNLQNPSEQARWDYQRAQARMILKNPSEAIDMLKSALDKTKGSRDVGLQSGLYRSLGLAYFIGGQYENALDAYRHALELSKDSTSLDTQWSCNLGVGKSLKALKRYAEAEPYLQKAVAIVEQERGYLTRDAFKTHNLDFRRDCFDELVRLYALENKPMEALEIAERGKARAFLDMLANKSTRRVETVIGTGNGGNAGGNIQLASAESGSRAVEIVGKRSVDVVTKGTDDPAQEEAVVEETAISPINAAAPTIDEIKQILSKRQSTCVEYLLNGDKIYVWVLGADGSVRMPPPIENVPQLRAVVQDLTAKMTTSSANRDELIRHNFDRQTQLHQLYSALIKPIEQWLPADKNSVITVIPDDFLFSVPFAALLDDHLRFLVEGHTLSYAPAIGVLRATQKLEDEVAEAPHKLLAFGNPITPEVAKVLGALPYTEKEVNHIAKLYGPDRSTVIIGAEANKETFKKLINGASEIHLATHGLVDQEHPMRSALVLAPSGEGDNGLLSVRDILTLPNLKARLVVLSACQTGKGQIAKDGVVGLSRAFIIAGTPSILVSQWNVDDAMTEFQMTRFYHSYLDGMDKARALREAQLETIRFMENVPEGQPIQPDPSKPRANPRYWAAFQLIGESK